MVFAFGVRNISLQILACSSANAAPSLSHRREFRTVWMLGGTVGITVPAAPAVEIRNYLLK
jgi:hypothetical protein